jgi:hypothetical protein
MSGVDRIMPQPADADRAVTDKCGLIDQGF